MGKTTSRDEVVESVPGWYVKFQAAVLEQLPRPGQLDADMAKRWLAEQGRLKEALSVVLAGEVVAGSGVEVVSFAPSANEIAARAIMGKNLFSVADAINHFKVSPTEKELAKLAEVPFSEATLRACANTHILCADFGLSVMDVWEQHTQLFYSKSSPWYGEKDQAKWARKRVKAQWRLLRKDVVPSSLGKDFRSQESLLGKGEKVPEVREMVYMVIGHFLASGEKLFPSYYARTKSLSGAGGRISMGSFDSDGLYIVYWRGFPSSDVGLASSGSSL